MNGGVTAWRTRSRGASRTTRVVFYAEAGAARTWPPMARRVLVPMWRGMTRESFMRRRAVGDGKIKVVSVVTMGKWNFLLGTVRTAWEAATQ